MPPLRDSELTAQTVVIGAGIIGLAAAFELARAGRRVLLLDRSGVAAEASRGNAGALAFSDILPLASPGILRKVPLWLCDPLGPLTLRPSYLPQIAPWLWRFWRASLPDKVAASTRVQVALMRLAAAATRPLLEAAGAADQLRDGGNLHLYESEAAWQRSLPGWQLRAAHGIELWHLHGRDAIAELQPGLSASLVAATFVPQWQTVIDPLQVALRLADALSRCGATLRQAEVAALQPAADTVRVRLSDGRCIEAQQVVVAAGAWSHRLARSLGDRVPLETERGYNTTLPPGAFDLRRQLTFPDHGFVVTPIAGGVRIGGAVELAGLRAAPNFARAQALLTKAQRFLPTLRSGGGTQWMGFRPSLPDSLPVIGTAAREPRVVYAFGHGHLGLTQAAATARLVRELVLGSPPSLDLAPLSVGRFSA
jgi:D-amino-acid dehydrogenase